MAGNAIEVAPTSSARLRLDSKQDSRSSGSASPACRFGPTVWMTHVASRSPAVVATAWPGGRPRTWVVCLTSRQASSSAGPAARWMAPSTPPPPSRDEFAGVAMASTESAVAASVAPAASEEVRIRGIDAGVDGNLGDIAFENRDLHVSSLDRLRGVAHRASAGGSAKEAREMRRLLGFITPTPTTAAALIRADDCRRSQAMRSAHD